MNKISREQGEAVVQLQLSVFNVLTYIDKIESLGLSGGRFKNHTNKYLKAINDRYKNELTDLFKCHQQDVNDLFHYKGEQLEKISRLTLVDEKPFTKHLNNYEVMEDRNNRRNKKQ